jgi:hypothetical protein
MIMQSKMVGAVAPAVTTHPGQPLSLLSAKTEARAEAVEKAHQLILALPNVVAAAVRADVIRSLASRYPLDTRSLPVIDTAKN